MFNKIFIGYATDLQARLNRHKAELKFGTHRNSELQELWRMFGESAFTFEILDLLEQNEDSPPHPEEALQILLEMWAQQLETAGDHVVLLTTK